MTPNEYQELATRTAPKNELWKDKMANFSIGLAGETGELLELIKKGLYHGHAMNTVKITKELGDAQWYLSQIAELFAIDLETVMITNIEKLKQRYPDKFTVEASINRSDDIYEKTNED